jgi:hypothetical protein
MVSSGCPVSLFQNPNLQIVMKRELRRCPISDVCVKSVLKETADPDQTPGIEWGKRETE